MKVANERLRPFSSSAQVKCRSYSYYLQRAIVDFGADVSFQEAQKKLLLKQSKHQDVLDGLRKRLPIDFEKQQESKKSKRKSKERLSEEKVEETPVEKCYRYISNRQNNNGDWNRYWNAQNAA